MARPERYNPYQLPLELLPPRYEEPIYPVRPVAWTDGEGLSRFTHVIREEVSVLSPADAGAYLLRSVFTPFEAFDQEEFWVLLLNRKYRATHATMLYRGNINSVVVRPVEVFKEAVRFNAPTILLSHIHPSGDPRPSPEDIAVTEMVMQAGKILYIEVLDHLIVGDQRFFSMRAEKTTTFED